VDAAIPCFWPWGGARVAPLRCPILRPGVCSIAWLLIDRWLLLGRWLRLPKKRLLMLTLVGLPTFRLAGW